MLSAAIGAPVSAALQTGGAQKLQTPEQGFEQQEQASKSAPAANSFGTPTIPATNGAPISVEAVTALQQVDSDQAASQQRSSTEAAASGPAAVAEGGRGSVSAEQASGGNSANGVAGGLLAEALASEQSSATEEAARGNVPQGEETDGAGRSERNPLNLQI
jgi:hypothetical protein